MTGTVDSSGPGDRERHRQAALRAYAILDTSPEPMFDMLARLAAAICETPMAAISLLDGDRQWFKAEVGLGVSQTGRDVSFCDHAARDPQTLLEVPDTHLDPRFVSNRLVTGDPYLRFYAGAPLQIDDGGDAIGALCVLDREPRTLTDAQRTSLVDLSALTMALLDSRRALAEVTEAGDGAVDTTLRELDAAQRLAQMGSWASDFVTGEVHWSDELYRLLGVPRSTRPSFDLFRELVEPCDRPLLDRMTVGLRAGQRHRAVLNLRAEDGQRKVLEAHMEVLGDATGGVGGVIGTTLDITAQRNLQDELLRRATTDALTGLPNRTAMLDELERALAEDRAADRPTSVVVLTIANFQPINEAFGIETADEVLRLVAGMVEADLPDAATVGRTGDSQFTCVLPATSTDLALGWCNQLADTVTARPLSAGGVSLSVELANGVSGRRSRSRTVQTAETTSRVAHDLLRRAVIASGINAGQSSQSATVYQSKWHAAARRKASLYDALHRAIDRDELAVVYQPLVTLATNAVVGAEALVRWTHPRLGPISPPEFIPIAESSGLIHELGRHVLHKACREAAGWTHPEPFGISVNVSGHQLASDAIVDVVDEALSDSGLDPHRLTIEVTETVLMHDPACIAERLQALTRLGAKIAVDDFGTGYSSLAYLAQFPVHTLKVDKTFVDDLDQNGRNRAIVAAILRLGDALGLTTLAEGIETSAQRAALIRLGCERGQGYFFSHPLPADQIRELLSPTPTDLSPSNRPLAAAGPI